MFHSASRSSLVSRVNGETIVAGGDFDVMKAVDIHEDLIIAD
jgi:hypothetical protein